MSYQESVNLLLTEKPDYLKTLRLAIQKEDENSSNKTYLGWEWYDVETHPAKLIRLVTSGVAKVNFKSNSSTCYLLKEREVVRKVLPKFEGKSNV